MFDSIKQALGQVTRMFLLRGYGWKRRKTIYLGQPKMQWRDPMSYVWVSEKAALKLLTVQVMYEFNKR